MRSFELAAVEQSGSSRSRAEKRHEQSNDAVTQQGRETKRFDSSSQKCDTKAAEHDNSITTENRNRSNLTGQSTPKQLNCYCLQ
jgi:hypothetical protein